MIAFITGVILGLLIRALMKSFLRVIVVGAVIVTVAGITTGKTGLSPISLIPVLLAARKGG